MLLARIWKIGKMDSDKFIFLSVLSFAGIIFICDISSAAPAQAATGNDLPANWEDLIGPEALKNTDSHILSQGHTIFEGDIKGVDRKLATSDPNSLSSLAHNAVVDRSQLWPNGLVPYTIGSGYNSQQKSVIEGAMRDIMSKTCVKFVTRTNERDYITFINRKSGCSSYVARVGGQQLIDLQEGCIYDFGEVQHEIMHALGFFHEQSRKDRDDFVTIVWSNIERDNYDQFEKYQSNLLGLPYDYDSIMHYGWNYFALNRAKPTIVPKSKAGSIGNRKVMSPVDVQKINLLYQCTGSKAPSGNSGSSRPSSSGSSGGSRPSSGSSGSRGSGSSILDILFGGSSSSRDREERPATRAPAAPAPDRGSSSSSSGGGLKGAITSFLTGLFG